MKIIQVHNFYKQAGGEDSVVVAERKMLESYGHKVVFFSKRNDEIAEWSVFKKIMNIIWNRQASKELGDLIDTFKPDVIHVHNIFHAISLSIYSVAHKKGVPVIQTLHNYRLFCLNGLFFRHGKVCENCLKCGKIPVSGMFNKCYRNSFFGSFIVALSLIINRIIKTSNKVSAYIALTEFQKQKLIDAGLPAEKIVVKPNFMVEGISVGDKLPEVRSQQASDGDQKSEIKNRECSNPFILFVGRLSPEKGCDVLIKAWSSLTELNGYKLLIVGDGPARESFEEYAKKNCLNDSINFLGKLPRESVLELMNNATCLVLPSLWYEGFPMTIVEAFSNGCPVIASNLGSMSSIIEDAKNGLKFEIGNVEDLAEKLSFAISNPQLMKAMGVNARLEFENKYSADVNYRQLMAIYKKAISSVT